MLKDKKYSPRSISDGSDGTPAIHKANFICVIVSVIITLVCLLALILLPQILDAEPLFSKKNPIGWVVLAIMAALIAINAVIWAKDNNKKKSENKELLSNQRFPIGLLNRLEQPAAIFDTNGFAVWANASFRKKAPLDILVSSNKYNFLTLFAPIGFVNAPDGTVSPELKDTPVSGIFEYIADTGIGLSVFGRDGLAPVDDSPEMTETTAKPEGAKAADSKPADKKGDDAKSGDNSSTAQQKALIEFERAQLSRLSARSGLDGAWVLHAYRHTSSNQTFYLVVLTDETELRIAKKQYDDDSPMCAYIVVDNLEELISREQESYRRASANVDAKIKMWSSELGAVTKEYERDKYIMLFRHEKLKEIIDSDFSILKSVREITVGAEDFPVTISIGISKPTGSLLEKERSAQMAIDTALKRGGNQAIVYLSDTVFKCYGARDEYKPQSHSGVHTRVFAEKLLYELKRCENVIIMGHKNPDFDSIGSCAGMARLALAYGKNVHLIINENDRAMSEAISKLKTLPDYDLLFKSYMTGMDKLPQNSILICCDANNLKQFENSALVSLAERLFIIDHHRKNEFTPTLSDEMRESGLVKHELLIIPSASSASELVAEILEHALPVDRKLEPEEADVMFAGLLLDTKQFTRNTQPTTFAAALYLRNNGADPTRAQALFKTDLTDYQIESEFGTDVLLERECVAIACEDSDDVSPTKRIAAAKTADRLLNVKNIRASFAVARMNADVFISARSDGSINVQLIMEALGGGGHYNAAATVLKNIDVDAAITRLCLEIRRYFREYDATQPPSKAIMKEIYALVSKRKKSTDTTPPKEDADTASDDTKK